MYIVAHVLPGCILGITLDVLVLINRKEEDFIHRNWKFIRITGVTTKKTNLVTALQKRRLHFDDTHARHCIERHLLESSYFDIRPDYLVLWFLHFFPEKIAHDIPGSEKAKSIYRSLFLISLSVVLGYFSTVIIVSMNELLNLKFNIIYLSLFAGLFATLATSVNFFIYYGIRLAMRTQLFPVQSKEYRAVFDELLGIGRLKRMLFKTAALTTTGRITITNVG
ncbi:hypothetical protein OSTOST_02970 [Ostertagia ostertagi]